MSILQELVTINDPSVVFEANVPIELKAIVDAFPKHHGKAFQKLWGGQRLVWHGMPFFGDGELGDAYVQAEDAAKTFIADDYTTEARLPIEGEVDGEEASDDVEWEVKFDPSNMQECYLGYDPQRDVLYIGFDAWSDEDVFHEAFDEAFQRLWNVPYDSDNPEHEAVFSNSWKQYRDGNFGSWGLVFEISYTQSGDLSAEEAFPPEPGGFYRRQYRQFKAQHPTVIDLRLD